MTVEFRQEAVYARFHVTDVELSTSPSADTFIKERIARIVSDKLAEIIVACKGGVILTPLTIMESPDPFTQVREYTGVVNAQRLPDPASGAAMLHDGPLSGTYFKVGEVPPPYMRFPFMEHSVYAIEGQGGARILEYKHLTGTMIYCFVGESRLG